MMPRHACVLLAFTLSGTGPLAAAEPRATALQEISASYNVLMNGFHVAVMNETFQARDSAYRIVSESSAVGLLALFERQPVRLVSTGQISAAGLRPLHFEGGRSEADPRRVRADFDWQASQLTLMHDGKTDTVPLPLNTQDRLSVMYQFMFHALDKLPRFEFAMTNGRGLEHYRYAVNPGVEIDTPLGRMNTLHLVKQREAGDGETEIWLAPQHHFLPVRMLIQENDGARYEQIVVKLEIKP
jgi:hypothetical protein